MGRSKKHRHPRVQSSIIHFKKRGWIPWCPVRKAVVPMVEFWWIILSTWLYLDSDALESRFMIRWQSTHENIDATFMGSSVMIHVVPMTIFRFTLESRDGVHCLLLVRISTTSSGNMSTVRSSVAISVMGPDCEKDESGRVNPFCVSNKDCKLKSRDY